MATTEVRTVGSGRNYSSWQAWEDACPANLVTADQIWQGQGYNDAEFVVTAAIALGGVTTDATRYMEMRCATGQSFTGNAANALRYNPSNGVAIKQDTGYSGGAVQVQTGIHARIHGLQLRVTTNANNGAAVYHYGSSLKLRDCILLHSGAHASVPIALMEGAAEIVNCVLYSPAARRAMNATGALVQLRNCTLHSVGGDYAVHSQYNSASVVKNCAVFGFSAYGSNPSNFDGTASTNNATNLGSINVGSGLTSLTASSQFESLTGGSEDFRVKTGAGLIGAGVRDQSYTNDLDAFGQSRSITAPTIGAYEVYVAPSGSVLTRQRGMSGGMQGMTGGLQG